MFGIGERWHASADELEQLIPELNRVRAKTLDSLSGQTAKAAHQQFGLLFDGDASVAKLSEAMRGLGDLGKTHGTELEYTKLQVLAMLAIAAAEISYALAMWWWTDGASLSWIPVIEEATAAAVAEAVEGFFRRIAVALEAAFTQTGSIQILKAGGHEVV